MKKYGFTLYAIGYIIIIVAVIGFIFNPIGSLFAYIPYVFYGMKARFQVGAFSQVLRVTDVPNLQKIDFP